MKKENKILNKKVILNLIILFFVFICIFFTTQYFKKSLKNSNADDFVISHINKCPDNNRSCLRASAELLLNTVSYDDVMSAIKKNMKDPEIFSACHQISHEFGRIEYEKSKNIRKVFSSGDNTCYEGYYHGATEAYFLDKNISADANNETFINSIPNICGNLDEYPNNDYYISCLHGLGHSVMYITDNEVPVALKLCDELSTINEKEGCYSGVFMENRQDEFSVDHPTKYIDKNDPSYPCNSIDSKYRNSCYGYQAVRVYINSGFIFSDAVKFCERAPEENQARCIGQVSGHLTGYPREERALSKDCMLISSKKLRSECVVAVARRFIQRDSGSLSHVTLFCEALDKKNKELCMKAAKFKSSTWKN